MLVRGRILVSMRNLVVNSLKAAQTGPANQDCSSLAKEVAFLVYTWGDPQIWCERCTEYTIIHTLLFLARVVTTKY